ncbi:hypothetical protein SH528x_003412 [Novipirellula sp. SH528]|uniref:hypothetical protein n=1 Tax=Novipirellula sp. SH528 TaxID=3454466 RepID=UPI003F9EC353
MREHIAVVFLIAILLSFGCSPAQRTIPQYDLVDIVPESWTMSPDEAVLAATEYCAANQIDLSRHGIPRLGCDSLDGERLWSFLYDGVTQMVGNHFMLLLNDETGAIEYVAGE